MSTSNNMILLKDDHQLLTKALDNDPQFANLSESDKTSIKTKLANAEKVTAEDFPNSVSRLHDIITIRNIKTRSNIQYQLVPPSDRDEWNDKISAISPLGINLLGVVKGQTIVLNAGKKKKHYSVMEVINAAYI